MSFTGAGRACSKHHRGTTMEHYAGIDVSLESSSVCVVDATGRVVREAKIAASPRHSLAGFTNSMSICTDWIGGWSAVAMALCGDARRWACGGAAGDAAHTRRVQGDAGED